MLKHESIAFVSFYLLNCSTYLNLHKTLLTKVIIILTENRARLKKTRDIKNYSIHNQKYYSR